MELLLMFFGGFLIGVTMATIFGRRHTKVGTLRIDHSNPEKDIFRMDINNIINLKQDKKYIVTVDHNADLSQK